MDAPKQFDLPAYYARMLDWKVENGVIKAIPKRTLSDAAHKSILQAFKKLGGKFVSPGYYELVTGPVTSASTVVAVNVKRAYELQKEA